MSGRRSAPDRIRQTKPVERSWSIPVHENMGVLQQHKKALAVLRRRQIQPRAALAERDLSLEQRLFPTGRIDAQHLGAEARKRARGHRPGENARQIEDFKAIERSERRRLPVFRRRARSGAPTEQRLLRDSFPLLVGAPCVARAHRRRRAARLYNRRLENVFFKRRDRGGDALAIRGAAQNAQRRRFVQRRIGVQPDPSVGRSIDAGDRVPDRRQTPSVRLDREIEPERGEPAINGDGGRIPP